MMMENNINLYFLCGLPHSGSCVLSSILNQHRTIHVETNSDLFSITGVTHAKWKEINNSNDTKKHYNIINGIIYLVNELNLKYFDFFSIKSSLLVSNKSTEE